MSIGTRPDYAKATRHLSRRHPAFKTMIQQFGPCTLLPDTDHFGVLVRSIIAQLISTKAATTISQRVYTLVAPHPVTPASLAAQTDLALRDCGISSMKVRYLRALQNQLLEDPAFLARLDRLPEEQLRPLLGALPGIGPWTLDMFLMFSLGRMDVLPVGDLGVRLAVQDHFGLAAEPRPQELRTLAEPWRPFRTVACWYLWRSRGFVPQSGLE